MTSPIPEADARYELMGIGELNMTLRGKVALVTGAGRHQGLGKAICARLAMAGCRIALTDLAVPQALMEAKNIGTRAEMDEVAEELSAIGPEVIALPMDVRDEAQIEATIAAVVAKFGRLDILINNAGIGYLFSPITDTPAEFWRAVMDVNLMGPFLCTKHAARQMNRQGSGGRIINIASQAAKSGAPSPGGLYCVQAWSCRLDPNRGAGAGLAGHYGERRVSQPCHHGLGFGSKRVLRKIAWGVGRAIPCGHDCRYSDGSCRFAGRYG